MYLLEKVVGRNISELILHDYEYHGMSYIREVYNIPTFFNTINKEFTIRFNRYESQYFLNPTSNRYICNMTFVNNLGINVVSLDFTDSDALLLLDSCIQFNEFYVPDISIPIISANNRLLKYVIQLNRVKDNNNNTLVKLSILQSDISNNYIPRLSCYMTENDFSDEFMYLMYFSYLIDIDLQDKEYMEYITQSIIGL